MPSSYFLHMRARSSGVVFPLPEVLGITHQSNGARRANLFIGVTVPRQNLCHPTVPDGQKTRQTN
jgi:hypothetical protein